MLAHALLGRSVTFRTHQGKFLCAEKEGKLVADRGEAKEWEHFQIIAVDAKDFKAVKVNIRSHHGKFLCSESDKAVVNRGEAKEWELWTIVDLGNGTVALHDYRGKYLCVEGPLAIHVNREKPQAWEALTPTIHLSAEELHVRSLFNTRVALKAHNNKFLCAEVDGKLVADRDDAKEWETWQVTPIHPHSPFSQVNLRSHHGKYLCSDNGAPIVNRDSAREWEAWTLVGLGGGKIALKDYRGKFLCVEGPHKIVVNRDAAKEWETLHVHAK
jgi:hypothetical protein